MSVVVLFKVSRGLAKPGLFSSSLVRGASLHTSPSSLGLPPVLLTLAAPLVRVTAFIAGRSARLWWSRLPPERKSKIKTAFLKQKTKLVGGVAVFAGCLLYGYQSHVQICPITNRKKFVALTPEQTLKISETSLENNLAEYSETILPSDNPVYKQVSGIAQRLLQANKDLPGIQGKDWTIILVNEDIINAFVLPTGHIFVFEGMYRKCSTEGELNADQLAMILGHEMAHAILNHTAETLTMTNFLQGCLLIPMAVLWAFIPSDGIAFITHWFVEKVVHLLVELPFSRDLETEADAVGLVLAAKACFDVREAPAFWGRLEMDEEVEEIVKDGNIDEEMFREVDKLTSYASTHPANITRQEDLMERMEEAMKMRMECGCKELDKEKDPCKELRKVKQELIEKQAKIGEHIRTRREIERKLYIETHRGVPITFANKEEQERQGSGDNSFIYKTWNLCRDLIQGRPQTDQEPKST